MKHIFTFLLFAIWSLGCQRDDPPTPVCSNCPPVTKDTLGMELLWKVPITSDTSWRDGERPFVYQGRVLLNERDLDNKIDYIHVLDKTDGKRLLKLRPNPSTGMISSASGMYQKENWILFTMWSEVYCFNMASLALQWETKVPRVQGIGSPHIGLYGDYVYHEHSESSIRDTFSHLVRSRITTGKWDTVFTVVNTDGFTPSLSSVNGYKHPTGDTILFFQDRAYNFDTQQGRIDMYAYNLKADTLLWKLTDFVPEQNSNVIQPPLVYNGDLYFLGAKALYRIDCLTGKVRWTRRVDNSDNTVVASMYIAEGKIFFKSVGDASLYALEPETGGILWSTPNLGYSTPYMTYSNGMLYFTSKSTGHIYGVRTKDGKKMLELTSINDTSPGKAKGNANFWFVEVDQQTGYLYANDGYFFMCYKPKS